MPDWRDLVGKHCFTVKVPLFIHKDRRAFPALWIPDYRVGTKIYYMRRQMNRDYYVDYYVASEEHLSDESKKFTISYEVIEHCLDSTSIMKEHNNAV